METRAASALELRREEMDRWRWRFLAIALPLWFALSWLGLFGLSSFGFSGSTSWGFDLSAVFANSAQLVLLSFAVLFWRALHRYAREAGGARYALGQLLLAIVLTPFLFAGIWAVPLLIQSDVDKGLARHRAERAAPLWFVALDSAVVLALIYSFAVLVVTYGVVGLLAATVLLPAAYTLFRVATRAARA